MIESPIGDENHLTTVLANSGATRRESVLTVRTAVSEAWEAEGRARKTLVTELYILHTALRRRRRAGP